MKSIFARITRFAFAVIIAACSRDEASVKPNAPSVAPSIEPAAITSSSSAIPSSSGANIPTLATLATSSALSTTIGPIGGNRPLRTLHIPSDPKSGEKFPLIIELHGYGADGPSQDRALGFASLVESARVILAAPDGLRDSSSDHFWSATDTCCNFENNPVDDVAYIKSLVSEIEHTYAVDPSRVYAVGHSNGGSMAQRLACDASEIFAAVVSVAGPGFEDQSKCKPSHAVSLRHMHGTRDGLIPYAGGPIPSLAGHHPKGNLPAAVTITNMFAKLDGCDEKSHDVDGALDFDALVPGAESHVARYDHCKDGSSVELVTMDHVGHFMSRPTADFTKSTWEFLHAHTLAH